MSDGPGGGGSGADGMTTTPSIDLTTWMHLVDTLPGGAALVSDDWRIVHANAPLCHDCMRHREDLVGTSLLDLVTHRPSKAAQPTDFPPAERQRYELVGGSRRLRLEATLLALSAPCDEAAFLWFVHDSSVVDEFAVSGLEASEKGFALALKGANENIKTKFFDNMSERAAKLLKEDMQTMGMVRVRDVDEAQSYVVVSAKELANSGEIIIHKGSDADEQLIE